MRAARPLVILSLALLMLVMVVPAAGARPPLRGGAAVKALGKDLPGVAKRYGMSATALAQELRADRDLGLDARGQLFYSCGLAAPAGAEAAATAGTAGAATVVPLAETFTLHSRPGAERVLYLDFDGATLTGTAWNNYDPDGTGPLTPSATIVAPAFDTDGDAASFSDAERTLVQQVWQRVAEDYAPFAVDVTTEPPTAEALTRSLSTDTTYGMTVLISSISSYIGNYGGIAYVGVYSRTDTTNYYKPALVFPEKLGWNEKYIAEAAAHEAGHTLGLSHDGTTAGVAYYSGQGTGETGWAPIMGVGYYKNLTQWSKGEYTNANQLQDDLTVMQTYGMVLRPDEAGDTPESAVALPAGELLAASGVITTAADVDVYAFTAGAGEAHVAAATAALGADLDLSLELLDSEGTVLASSNPLEALSASLDPVLLPAAGTYYLCVSGVGAGDPTATGYSDYASLGQYSISASVPAAVAKQAPVAALTANPGELQASLDGGASVDPDGTIASYSWSFGDGESATTSEATAHHQYAAAGTYSVTLTVTDNDGLTGTAETQVAVLAANQAPTAMAQASTTTGTAPLAITFDGSTSTDPDGDALSYTWRFGDGENATGATASHTYAAASSYEAVLTVTDEHGASATSSVTISVSPTPAPALRVSALKLSLVSVRTAKQVKAVITVTDASGAPLSGASVSAVWSGLVSGTAKGTTGTNGTLTLTSKTFTKRGTVTLTVTSLAKAGYTYDPAANLISKASLTY